MQRQLQAPALPQHARGMRSTLSATALTRARSTVPHSAPPSVRAGLSSLSHQLRSNMTTIQASFDSITGMMGVLNGGNHSTIPRAPSTSGLPLGADYLDQLNIPSYPGHVGASGSSNRRRMDAFGAFLGSIMSGHGTNPLYEGPVNALPPGGETRHEELPPWWNDNWPDEVKKGQREDWYIRKEMEGGAERLKNHDFEGDPSAEEGWWRKDHKNTQPSAPPQNGKDGKNQALPAGNFDTPAVALDLVYRLLPRPVQLLLRRKIELAAGLGIARPAPHQEPHQDPTGPAGTLWQKLAPWINLQGDPEPTIRGPIRDIRRQITDPSPIGSDEAIPPDPREQPLGGGVSPWVQEPLPENRLSLRELR